MNANVATATAKAPTSGTHTALTISPPRLRRIWGKRRAARPRRSYPVTWTLSRGFPAQMAGFWHVGLANGSIVAATDGDSSPREPGRQRLPWGPSAARDPHGASEISRPGQHGIDSRAHRSGPVRITRS